MADRSDRYRDERDGRGEAWRERDERWRGSEGERPFTERASDEVRLWFGDEGARRRREFDERRDEPLCVCERLTRHGRIEAKRLAEDLAEDVFGVRDVTNQIKVSRAEMQAVGTAGAARDPGGAAIEGLAGTANTPEITPPDRGEPKKA